MIAKVNESIEYRIDIRLGVARKKFNRFITLSFSSLRTTQAKECSLDKEQTSYDDLLDALRLSLKGYSTM